jgi:hypothetical protein
MLTKCCDDFKHVSIETTTKLNQILNGCSPSITDSQRSEILQEIRHQCQIYTKIYREIVDYQKSFICIWCACRYGNGKLVEASPVLNELNLITMNRKMSSRSQDSNPICSVLEIYSNILRCILYVLSYCWWWSFPTADSHQQNSILSMVGIYVSSG